MYRLSLQLSAVKIPSLVVTAGSEKVVSCGATLQEHEDHQCGAEDTLMRMRHLLLYVNPTQHSGIDGFRC